MIDYKFIMDGLASAASFVAIATVLWSWFKNSQKPLKIDRVVIHKKKSESTYILIVKNRKSYPVKIKLTNCYIKHSYRVEQRPNQKPEYRAALDLADSPFVNTEKFKIVANGHTDIRISGLNIDGAVHKLLFSIHTYHEVWCKNIVVVNMIEGTEVFSLEHKFEYSSLFKAKIKYYWLVLLNIFK